MKLLTSIWREILKIVYRRLIVDVIVLDESALVDYEGISPFYVVNIDTPNGIFTFQFKKDRRSVCREKGDILPRVSYIVKLIPPDEMNEGKVNLKDKLIVVVKKLLFKLDKRALVEVLSDVYLDTILGEIDT